MANNGAIADQFWDRRASPIQSCPLPFVGPYVSLRRGCVMRPPLTLTQTGGDTR